MFGPRADIVASVKLRATGCKDLAAQINNMSSPEASAAYLERFNFKALMEWLTAR